ncbi:hypothetical protein M2281_002973 [Mesorhizobium soli]|uniref:hypothetical protein n=1 Tax=Pseudaminobacter soli (ex Li et al. 2025) TaxID=1295366 RepID=UPI002472F9CD|nr:hypothetical protein [Mesorhizobium soli]MDH6232374.1 hypothetical protein [Mesorhizobium soli]
MNQQDKGKHGVVTFRAINNGKSARIEAEEIEVTLPNGVKFLMSPTDKPGGGISLHIPEHDPEALQFGAFSIEPGAANTIFLRAVLYDRDIEDGLRPEDLNASNDD